MVYRDQGLYGLSGLPQIFLYHEMCIVEACLNRVLGGHLQIFV